MWVQLKYDIFANFIEASLNNKKKIIVHYLDTNPKQFCGKPTWVVLNKNNASHYFYDLEGYYIF